MNRVSKAWSSNGPRVAMSFGPFASSEALYYTTFANGGEVRRLAYTALLNRAPIARASATPTSPQPTPPTLLEPPWRKRSPLASARRYPRS